VIRRD